MAPAPGAGVTRMPAAVVSVAFAAPAAVGGTTLGPATIVLAAIGLAALVAALVTRRAWVLAVALALLGTAYAAGLGAGVDAWAPLHAGALVLAAELADRSMRAVAIEAPRLVLVAIGATAVAAVALAVSTIDANPGEALRLAGVAAAGAAVVAAAARRQRA